MKTRTLFGILLLLPFVVAIITIPIVFDNEPAQCPIMMRFEGIVSLYTSSIVFWGIPYLILSIGLFFWSKDKSTKSIFKIVAYSPIFLALAVLLKTLAVSLLLQAKKLTLPFSLVAVVMTLLFGYLYFALGALIYKLFKHFKYIR